MASSAAPPGVIDPTKPKSYPVILSDALLGKSPKEALTAIRYNHKPELSSDTAPNEAKLKPSPSDDDTFNLSFYENGGKYAYNGTRSAKENQYVLIFDPERKAFVLHRMDSMFHMNLARTPYNSDAQELKGKYPHIDSNVRSTTDKKKAPTSKREPVNKKNSSEGKKKEAPAAKSEAPDTEAKSSQQSQADKNTKPKKQQRNRSPAESDEDDDEDGGLLVEYPDPAPSAPTRGQDFSPAFPTAIRRFSEFMRDEGPESDEDADAEYDEEDILGEEDDDVEGEGGNGFKLPSPVVAGGGGAPLPPPPPPPPPPPQADDDGDMDLDDDFEAELEKELEQLSSMEVDDAGGDAESDVSEED
ncbi:RNA polymerase II transcription elongation factor-domain-containing protein [Diaporthe sp. PMI_573]|nr:RNA polymerase II transcription elongation factor-domain-containing protein [Diaporthaceae sp. PMI_573]